MARRAWTPVIALATALGLAACGSGGDPTAFASATDRTCRDLAGAVSTLRTQLVRSDARSEQAGLATALDAYATTVRREASLLSSVDPPNDDTSFRDAAVKGLRTHADAMHEAATDARRGRVARALARQLPKGAGGTIPDVPDAVLADAPSCRADAR